MNCPLSVMRPPAAAFVLMLAITIPGRINAQQLSPVAFHQQRAEHSVLAYSVATQRPNRSRAPYIITGAVLGGAIAGALAYHDLKHSDAYFGQTVIALVAAGGALVGALLGWGVYEARY